MGISYHRGYREDRTEIPAEGSSSAPLLLSFHLEALSRVLKKGSRLRIAVSCGGSGYQQPEGFPEDVLPTVSLYTGSGTDSAVTLPVVKPGARTSRMKTGRKPGSSGPRSIWKKTENSKNI